MLGINVVVSRYWAGGGSTSSTSSVINFLSLPSSWRPVTISTSPAFASSVRCASLSFRKLSRSALIFCPTILLRCHGSDSASKRNRNSGSSLTLRLLQPFDQMAHQCLKALTALNCSEKPHSLFCVDAAEPFPTSPAA